MSNITDAQRGLINFYDVEGSNGLGVHYFEEWTPGVPFIEIFLQRVKMVKGLNHVVAYVNPNLVDRLTPYLEKYSIQPLVVENMPAHVSTHRRMISSRKWSYQAWMGCPSELSYFDEVVAMGLIGHFNELTKPSKLVYFTPEAPFFNPQATNLMLEKLGSSLENKKLGVLCQPSPMGMSAFCIDSSALNELSATSVWLPKEHVGGDFKKQSMKLRNLLGLPLVPNDRRNFLLRSRRDAKRLKAWDGKFDAIDELSDEPRDVQLEITASPFSPLCRLPALGSHEDMPVENLQKILSNICEIDDALLTIGDLGNILEYDHLKELKELLIAHKPYGTHVVLDGKVAFEDIEETNSWLDLGLDIVTIRMTSIGNEKADLEAHESAVIEMSKRYNDPDYHTIINFELHKYHDNWRLIEVLQKWKENYKMPFSWIGWNDYCGQTGEEINLPVYAPRIKGNCQKLIHQMHILPDGSVTPCRQDFSGKNVVANVLEKGLFGAWNCEELQAIRAKNEPGDEPTELCAGCHQGYFV
jgi:hypothetical protein